MRAIHLFPASLLTMFLFRNPAPENPAYRTETSEGGSKMKRIPLFPAACLVLLAACAEAPTDPGISPQFASAHFIGNQVDASGPDDAGNLSVNFKIAGLGDNVTTTVTASADGTAVYACQNNGGNFPEDPKKEEVSGPVSASGEFTSGKNGQITGSLTLSPPASSLECPPGQNRVLASVSYTNVQVSEPNAGTQSIPGTFSRTFFEL
jgi:hypothetical protein